MLEKWETKVASALTKDQARSLLAKMCLKRREGRVCYFVSCWLRFEVGITSSPFSKFCHVFLEYMGKTNWQCGRGPFRPSPWPKHTVKSGII